MMFIPESEPNIIPIRTPSPGKNRQVRCKEYSISSDIQDHIDIIRPTVHFNENPSLRQPPGSKTKRSGLDLGSPSSSKFHGPKVAAVPDFASPSLDNCDQLITLDCLRALYNIDYTPVATDRNTHRIVEFTPQAYLADDLDLFFCVSLGYCIHNNLLITEAPSNFSPSQVGDWPVLVSIDGGVVQTQNQSFDFNGESDLDLQYAMGLVNPQTITLLQTGDLVEGAGFDNWLDAVDGSFCTFEGGDDPTQDGIYPDPLPGGFKGPESCGIIAPPNGVSISYSQNENTLTARTAIRQCMEYGKLGLMGTTVFYSSGDDGVAGNGNLCMNVDPSEFLRLDPVLTCS
ncbi:hypothetical protein V5O48_017162 [Marasmius crinis-equi]|uniref:GON domain-containing protein n=1 Tax=Marasmius crinis-equi TaxID=585013 RepID=A0ABR3EPZ1_9AGAR